MRRWKPAIAASVLLLSGSLAALGAPAAQALDNGVARTPPMGWNSWNAFGCAINETLIRQMADAMVSSGMRDLGYQYVVVDDCWFNPSRDSAGNLQGDPVRFPSGMRALGDYLHAKGLKFGIYQVPVDRTCAQYFGSYPGATGSQGHEVQRPAVRRLGRAAQLGRRRQPLAHHRGHDRHRDAQPLRPLGDAGLSADRRQRPALHGRRHPDDPEEPQPHRDQPGRPGPAGDADLHRRHPA